MVLTAAVHFREFINFEKFCRHSASVIIWIEANFCWEMWASLELLLPGIGFDYPKAFIASALCYFWNEHWKSWNSSWPSIMPSEVTGWLWISNYNITSENKWEYLMKHHAESGRPGEFFGEKFHKLSMERRVMLGYVFHCVFETAASVKG